MITQYVKNCIQCQKAKKKPKIAYIIVTETLNEAFDTVLTDTIGLLPRTENGNVPVQTKYDPHLIRATDQIAKSVFSCLTVAVYTYVRA